MATITPIVAFLFHRGSIFLEELEALIFLNSLPQLGSIKIRSLMRHFGSAVLALKAPLEEIAALPGFGPRLLQSWKTGLEKKVWEEELKLAERSRVAIIPFTSPYYPKRLLDTSDFPILLYIQGSLLKEDARCLAVVGTRQASIYGLEIAKTISRELASAGFTIVSGLARGVDTAAHQGALQGGRTCAVLGSGLSRLYPQENTSMAEVIKQQGALISEFSMAAPPNRHHFPQRNRIVSGLSLGTIVIEAPLKSGAMLTAERAVSQGRPAFALPGRSDQETHRGNHQLIKEGKAKLIENGRDILQFFDACPLPQAFASFEKPHTALEKDEAELLKKMPIQEASVEELAMHVQWPIGKLNGLLMSLVLKKMIKEYPGKIYKKV